ncbi:MAG: hypothetical protein ACAI34_25305 [Verrucomicrobium sp.]
MCDCCQWVNVSVVWSLQSGGAVACGEYPRTEEGDEEETAPELYEKLIRNDGTPEEPELWTRSHVPPLIKDVDPGDLTEYVCDAADIVEESGGSGDGTYEMGGTTVSVGDLTARAEANAAAASGGDLETSLTRNTAAEEEPPGEGAEDWGNHDDWYRLRVETLQAPGVLAQKGGPESGFEEGTKALYQQAKYRFRRRGYPVPIKVTYDKVTTEGVEEVSREEQEIVLSPGDGDSEEQTLDPGDNGQLVFLSNFKVIIPYTGG